MAKCPICGEEAYCDGCCDAPTQPCDVMVYVRKGDYDDIIYTYLKKN